MWCNISYLKWGPPSYIISHPSDNIHTPRSLLFTYSLLPGTEGEGQRAPGDHCLCMRQVPMVICILHCYTKITTDFILPADCWKATLLRLCSLCDIQKDLKSQIVLLEVTDCSIFWKITSLCVVALNWCVDDSCNRRAGWFHHSLVIIHTQHGWWYASFTWEKLTDSWKLM